MSNAAATRASGIAIAASPATETSRAVAETRAILGPGPFQHIIAFFSAKHDATQLRDRLREAFPGVPVSGCSTAGEITPAGMVEGGILLLAFPPEGFRIHADVIEDIDHFGVERGGEIVRRLKSQVRTGGGTLKERVFALMLIDGLSNREEMLVAAIHWAIDDVEFVGGSAGDGLASSAPR